MESFKIVNYETKYKSAFRSINEAWIRQYFKVEPSDQKALIHPKEYILDKGGAILIALYEDQPIGACALIKIDHPKYDFELAKMGLDPAYHGRGFGQKICQATIDKAVELGATWIYLESNTVLKPAIELYKKLGFEKIEDFESPYERCNIQMGLKIG